MPTIAAARTLIQMTELPSVMALAADEIEGGGLPTFDPSKPQALVIGSAVVLTLAMRAGVETIHIFFRIDALNNGICANMGR